MRIHPVFPDWRGRAKGDFSLKSLAESAIKSSEPRAKEIAVLAAKGGFDSTLIAAQISGEYLLPQSWGSHRWDASRSGVGH